MQYKHFNVQLKGVDDEKSIITGVFSTADEDRHGEVVDQKSWQLDDYLKNPVILFAHDHNQPAIGKAVNLSFNADGNLEGQIQFATKEYEFANTIYKLYKGGYMRAFSVGFQNEVYEVDQENEKVTLKKNNLFEISTVNVPANQMALAKAKGIDTSALEKHLESTNSYDEEKHDILEETVGNVTIKYAEKEGRVLSSKNKSVIVNAVDALNKLLEADGDKSISPISNDNAAEPIKVVTPTSKGVHNPARILNKAVRALLAEKRNLTN